MAFSIAAFVGILIEIINASNVIAEDKKREAKVEDKSQIKTSNTSNLVKDKLKMLQSFVWLVSIISMLSIVSSILSLKGFLTEVGLYLEFKSLSSIAWLLFIISLLVLLALMVVGLIKVNAIIQKNIPKEEKTKNATKCKLIKKLFMKKTESNNKVSLKQEHRKNQILKNNKP